MDMVDENAVPDRGRVIDARARFPGLVNRAEYPCRECGKEGTALFPPHVDRRRRKPWPQPYWLCAECDTADAAP